MKSLDGLDWAEVNKTIMFDDDRTAVSEEEQDRLVTVASYDHWAKCPWDENVNEEMLARNPDALADIVRARSVRVAYISVDTVKVTAFLMRRPARAMRATLLVCVCFACFCVYCALSCVSCVQRGRMGHSAALIQKGSSRVHPPTHERGLKVCLSASRIHPLLVLPNLQHVQPCDHAALSHFRV